MEKLAKKSYKNGLKKDYIVYGNIQPKLSAIDTKLCSDRLDMPPELMYLLGNGYSREIKDERLVLFNDTFISDLSGCLGIYLEDYEEADEETFYEAIRKNSAINIAPPMIYVKYMEGTYLSIVCKVFDDHSYDVISPVDKEIVHITSERAVYNRSWYMMNSPRFISPVFRSRNQLMEEALYRMKQKRNLVHTTEYQKIYEMDVDIICEKAAEYITEEDISERYLFHDAMKLIEKYKEHYGTEELLENYIKILSRLKQELTGKNDRDEKYALIRGLFQLEDKIMDEICETVEWLGEKQV